MEQDKNIPIHQLTPPWKKYAGAEPLDRLLDQSLLAVDRQEGPAGRYRGRMKFDHMALMGPPGRLQGGLHCVGRCFPILKRIPEHQGENPFPCAFYVRLGKPLPLFKDVDFTAGYARRGPRQWHLTTRFSGTERLDAALWPADGRPEFMPEHWSSWRDRYRKALQDSRRDKVTLFGMNYERTAELMWTTFETTQDEWGRNSLRRFEVEPGRYSLSFMCYHLDILGAMAQREAQEWAPHFTTHVALGLKAERIPAGSRLLAIADRLSKRPDRFSTLPPVIVNGEKRSTTIARTILTDEDFSEIHAYGWVSVHPISVERMATIVGQFTRAEAEAKAEAKMGT